jgi:hypothetical protein
MEASHHLPAEYTCLWHGKVDEALDLWGNLFLDLDPMRKRSAPAEKLAAGIAEFETYIGNKPGMCPEFRRTVPAKGKRSAGRWSNRRSRKVQKPELAENTRHREVGFEGAMPTLPGDSSENSRLR